MSIGGVLISFIWMLVSVVAVILVAWVIVMICGYAGFALSGEVVKWGRLLVGLICLAIVVTWLVSTFLGGVPFHPFR